MTSEEILKLAASVGLYPYYQEQARDIECFYRAAFNAGLEAAAKVVKASYRGVYDGETCAAAVRAKEMK